MIKGVKKKGGVIGNKYQAFYQDANATLRLWSEVINSKDCQIDSADANQWNKARDLKRNELGNYSFKNYDKRFEIRTTIICPQNNWRTISYQKD